MKENEGSQGKGVYLIENEDDYNNVYQKINDEYFCQEFIESSYGMDIRVYVLGDRVLGCVKRISAVSYTHLDVYKRQQLILCLMPQHPSLRCV